METNYKLKIELLGETQKIMDRFSMKLSDEEFNYLMGRSEETLNTLLGNVNVIENNFVTLQSDIQEAIEQS